MRTTDKNVDRRLFAYVVRTVKNLVEKPESTENRIIKEVLMNYKIIRSQSRDVRRALKHGVECGKLICHAGRYRLAVPVRQGLCNRNHSKNSSRSCSRSRSRSRNRRCSTVASRKQKEHAIGEETFEFPADITTSDSNSESSVDIQKTIENSLNSIKPNSNNEQLQKDSGHRVLEARRSATSSSSGDDREMPGRLGKIAEKTNEGEKRESRSRSRDRKTSTFGGESTGGNTSVRDSRSNLQQENRNDSDAS